MFQQDDAPITRIRTLTFLLQLYGKLWACFWIDTETGFALEISKNDQLKEPNFFCKTLQGSFKIALR